MTRSAFPAFSPETMRDWDAENQIPIGSLGRRQAETWESSWALRCQQLEAGASGVRYCRTREGDLSIVHASFDLSTHVTGVSPDNRISIILPDRLDGRCQLWGRNIIEDHLILFGPGREFDFVTCGETSFSLVEVTVERFRKISERIEWGSREFGNGGITLFRLESGQAEWLRDVLHEAIGNKSPFQSEEERALHEDRILLELCGAIPPNTYDGVCRMGTAPSLILCAKIATEFIEDHFREPAQVEEIAASAKVSVRTLQRCFREVFGISPITYWKLRRLGEVRTTLQSAAGGCLISKTAHANGFIHLGHFSEEYRATYGETPSETLPNAQLSPNEGAARRPASGR